MNIQESIDLIVRNYDNFAHDSKGGNEAVWVAKTDKAGSYEVDEEWIGVRANGTLVWAYASGCSCCWDGDYTSGVCDTMEIKSFEFEHKEMAAGWEKALTEFADNFQETGGIKEVEIPASHYDY